MMNNTNTIDKDAMRKKFEKEVRINNKVHIYNDIHNIYYDIRTSKIATELQFEWALWQAAYESCLAEFEQVCQVVNGFTVNNNGEYLANLQTLPNNTPLFTRKG